MIFSQNRNQGGSKGPLGAKNPGSGRTTIYAKNLSTTSWKPVQNSYRLTGKRGFRANVPICADVLELESDYVHTVSNSLKHFDRHLPHVQARTWWSESPGCTNTSFPLFFAHRNPRGTISLPSLPPSLPCFLLTFFLEQYDCDPNNIFWVDADNVFDFLGVSLESFILGRGASFCSSWLCTWNLGMKARIFPECCVSSNGLYTKHFVWKRPS